MNLLQDVRYTFRVLRKAPGFTMMAVLILALGIGANSAIFSIVNSVLLKPLPYPDANRLVVIWENNRRLGAERAGPSGPNYLDWKEQAQSFSDMALIEIGSGLLTGLGEPEEFPGARVTPNFLSLLGAKTMLGHTFSPSDSAGSSRHNVAVLTYAFWQRRFGSDPKVIGKPITVNHEQYTVIGVLGPAMWSPVRCDAFVPWPGGELRSRHRDWRDFGVIARLKPGVTVAQAQDEMNRITAHLAERYREQIGWGAVVVPFQDALVEYIRPALLLLLASVGFVLLLACANVGNLLLARITARQREIGIRAAMGASRVRVVRQFLTENVVLSLIGGGLGFLIAIWTVELLGRTLPKTIPLPNGSTEVVLPPITVDAAVLGFTIAVSFVCAALFGLLPALSASRADLNSVLKEGGRSSAGSTGHYRARRLLVISETALAFVLLMGAGLMLRSFTKLQNVNPGVRTEHVTTFHVRLPTDTLYKERNQRIEFFRKVLERVDTIPGVRSAGIINVLPLSQESARIDFHIEGRPTGPNTGSMADFREVSPAMFQTLGISLLRGRAFDQHDEGTAKLVAIVDEPFVTRFFPDEAPIGKRVLLLGRTFEIVGVVSGVRHYGLDKPPRPSIYVPYTQLTSDHMTIAVKTSMDLNALIPAVKRSVWDVDKDQPVFLIRSMDEYLSMTTSAPRIAVLLLGIFAALAIALAALGIYSVVSYTVSQRSHEFGVRMALGARPEHVRTLILKTGAMAAATGLGIGLAAMLLLAPLLRLVLYGVAPVDAGVAAIAAAFLFSVALLANYIPAVRATRIDPLEALRYE